METFEKLGDFKKAVKLFVRGTIKTGILGNEGDFVFEVTKLDGDTKSVTITTNAGPYTFTLAGETCTRVFNKVEPELFEPIITQFEKIAKVKSITFNFA